MIEVFMLGVLVTLVKMVSLARVIPEAALFAFGALTLMFAVVVSFDPRVLWDLADNWRLDQARPRRRRQRGRGPRLASRSPAPAVAAPMPTRQRARRHERNRRRQHASRLAARAASR